MSYMRCPSCGREEPQHHAQCLRGEEHASPHVRRLPTGMREAIENLRGFVDAMEVEPTPAAACERCVEKERDTRDRLASTFHVCWITEEHAAAIRKLSALERRVAVVAGDLRSEAAGHIGSFRGFLLLSADRLSPQPEPERKMRHWFCDHSPANTSHYREAIDRPGEGWIELRPVEPAK